jgi:hypothetical protein
MPIEFRPHRAVKNQHAAGKCIGESGKWHVRLT